MLIKEKNRNRILMLIKDEYFGGYSVVTRRHNKDEVLECTSDTLGEAVAFITDQIEDRYDNLFTNMRKEYVKEDGISDVFVVNPKSEIVAQLLRYGIGTGLVEITPVEILNYKDSGDGYASWETSQYSLYEEDVDGKRLESGPSEGTRGETVTFAWYHQNGTHKVYGKRD